MNRKKGKQNQTDCSVRALKGSEVEGTLRYIQAHELLPEAFFENRTHATVYYDIALAMLGEGGEDGDRFAARELLFALVVLGHAGTKRALAALEGFAAAGGTYASVARAAHSECKELLDRGECPLLGAA
jgi:hypothetical protein